MAREQIDARVVGVVAMGRDEEDRSRTRECRLPPAQRRQLRTFDV
jgi:hypothetical protein